MLTPTGWAKNAKQSSGSVSFGGIMGYRDPQQMTCACGQTYLTRLPTLTTLCPMCGARLAAERQAKEEVKAKELTEATYHRNILRAGIPPFWKDITFDLPLPSNISPNQLDGLKRAQHFAKEYALGFSRKSKSLLISGRDVGVGKTQLAVCVANHLLHVKRMRVLFRSARDFLLELRSSFNSSETSEFDLLDELLDCDLLVLDDVGRDRFTDWVENTYWSIFNRCLTQQIPVVVTSNKPVQSPPGTDCLEDRIGSAAYSRLLAMCGSSVIELEGEDLR